MIELILFLLALLRGLAADVATTPPVPIPPPAATATPVPSTPSPWAKEPWALTRYLPPAEWKMAWAIEDCESKHCTEPDTYDLNAPDGGCMQINRATWEGFLLREHGWSWEDVVLNDDINYQVTAILWERGGNTWWHWRACLPAARP